jgi:cysteinyl-tRNA synthetase
MIELLVELRDLARDERDYEVSDRIRDALTAAGIELRDRDAGSTWHRVETVSSVRV